MICDQFNFFCHKISLFQCKFNFCHSSNFVFQQFRVHRVEFGAELSIYSAFAIVHIYLGIHRVLFQARCQSTIFGHCQSTQQALTENLLVMELNYFVGYSPSAYCLWSKSTLLGSTYQEWSQPNYFFGHSPKHLVGMKPKYFVGHSLSTYWLQS